MLIHEMLHYTGSVGADNANQEITLGNAQIPGTSAAGDIGLDVPDAAVGVATGVGIELQKKELERKAQQKAQLEREKKLKELMKRCGEGIQGTDGPGDCANVP
jgi:hypothetical protein